MFCTGCGKEVSEGAHFCANCGKATDKDKNLKTTPDTPAPRHGVLESIGNHISSFASTDRLEGFSLREFFSDVFKKREATEIDDYFVVGTSRTTPAIEDVPTGWPKPWFFFRVLIFLALVYLGFYLAWQQFQNPKLIPGLIMMGSLAAPLATVILFFELNAPRNISFNRILMLVASGGIVSLFVASIGFSVSDLGWMGASQAGIVEEIGKLLAVIIVARSFKGKYILNGLLYGAAVGAGFAFFESAGYAFEFLEKTGKLDVMFDVIQLRALLTPFGHVAWTAITAAALWRVKGDRPFQMHMLLDGGFLKTMLIPMVLHMAWDAPFTSPFDVHLIGLGIIGWFVVFGLVQQGLRQIRDEQMQLSQAKAIKEVLAPGPKLIHPNATILEGKVAEA
ncbi:MAG TPA: PrsW family intramembrane metalloprotease [Candidatus Sulfotelmatobacter sp.]|nr:PrsW family intramembrane metalloprotease [Candidatus Sulfotelmatobacter sp.]